MTQSTTKTFDIKNSDKLRSFAKKFERPTPPESSASPAPKPKDDIFERIDLANKIEQDNSIDDTIDVVPQTRFIMLFIIFNVMKHYKDLNTERPLLTPSSLVAYCMFQVYAFLLICDYYGRPQTSFPASDFMNDDTRILLLDILCRSYVPPFMLTIFHALADCVDPRRPGLQYFASLAGSIFDIDFGRLIPAQVFLHAHNISTDEDTSRNVSAAMMTLLNQMLFQNTVTSPLHVYVSHYFSAGYDATHHHESYVFEALRTLFSPVTGKSLLRRTNIQHIPVTVPRFSSSMNSTTANVINNQYILFLNADNKNARNMTKFISSMSTLVKSDFNATFQLGAVPDDMNGINILVHGYTQLALPTWHTIKHVTITNTKTAHDAEEYAAAIHFLQPYTKPTTSTDISWDKFSSIPNPFKQWILTDQSKFDDQTDFPKHLTFSEDIHVAPRTLYLDPYTSGDGPITYAMLAGLLIESFEIDGSSVPMPDPRIGLSVNNKQFLQGAVPLSHIHTAFNNAGSSAYNPFDRNIMRRGFQAINIDLYDMSENRLGMLTDTIVPASTSTPSSVFRIHEHVRNIREMFSKLSFTTEPSDIIDSSLVMIDAWSPYRYVSSNEDEHPQKNSTFMLINRRTEYGTHVPLVGTRHPSVLIPIS